MCETSHQSVDAEQQNQQQQKPRTRLLFDAPHSSASSASESPGGTLFRAECKALFCMGLPLALASVLDRSSLWVTAAFIGRHGGAAELGPASLASTVNNVFGTSVNIGLSLAVQTLASQAAGAGDVCRFGAHTLHWQTRLRGILSALTRLAPFPPGGRTPLCARRCSGPSRSTCSSRCR